MCHDGLQQEGLGIVVQWRWERRHSCSSCIRLLAFLRLWFLRGLHCMLLPSDEPCTWGKLMRMQRRRQTQLRMRQQWVFWGSWEVKSTSCIIVRYHKLPPFCWHLSLLAVGPGSFSKLLRLCCSVSLETCLSKILWSRVLGQHSAFDERASLAGPYWRHCRSWSTSSGASCCRWNVSWQFLGRGGRQSQGFRLRDHFSNFHASSVCILF